MKNEVVFSDLASLAVEQDRISRVRSLSTWEAVDYETEAYSGTMVVAPQDSHPGELTFPLNLHGWYKIHLCMTTFNGGMYTYVRLDSDKAFSGLYARREGVQWASYETAHEFFWKCAELNGDALHINRPESYANETSHLMWIRCEEMTEEEISAYKAKQRGPYKIHAHIDTDFTGHDNLNKPEDALTIMQHLEGSDVTMCSQEMAFDWSGYEDDPANDSYVGLTHADRLRFDAFRNFWKIREKAYPLMADYCKSIGIRLHAAMRMEMADFKFPYSYPNFQMRFADENPQWYMQTREGRTVKILSYAYPEVQDFVINGFVETFRKGFHGISLLWIRGAHIGFEEPVLKRVAEKYDGLDGRRLPASDERLKSVWCEFLTEFMRKLRRALDEEAARSGRERCNIHTVGIYTPELSREMGIDVAQWAKEGLIDGLTVAMYAHFENLNNCMGDDGLIDMERYEEAVKHQYMVKRKFVMDVPLMLTAIEEHEKLAEQYGVETFYSVDWEGNHPSKYAEQAKKFYEKGAKGIFTWDTNNRVKYPPEWHITSQFGHPEKLDTATEDFNTCRKIYKMLRLADNDISYVAANWRG